MSIDGDGGGRVVILVVDRADLGRPIRTVSRRKGGGFTGRREFALQFTSTAAAARWLARARSAGARMRRELGLTFRNARRIAGPRYLLLIDTL